LAFVIYMFIFRSVTLLTYDNITDWLGEYTNYINNDNKFVETKYL